MEIAAIAERPAGLPGLAAGAGAAELAANRAAGAFWHWASIPAAERGAHLEELAVALDRHRGRLVDIAAHEIGAAADWINFNTDLACQILRQATKLIPFLNDRLVENAERNTRSVLRRQAVGVVLGIAPWNAPVTLAVRALASPLACGNTVVLKASELCPRTHEALVEILNEAGLPEGVANVVSNAPDESEAVVNALVAHPAIRRINFTGSTRVGRKVALMAAQQLKRCLLELSGKAPLIVLDDADLEAAVDAAVFGAFFNQGQICMSTERIIVVEAVAAEFVERLVDRAKTLHAGDPRKGEAPLGSLINAQAAQRVSGLIEDAVSKGAKLLAGGTVEGAVMQPAVVDHVMTNMRLYHEESFGPVASVMRVADADEAVSIANDTEYGLTAAIFSRDEGRAAAIADRLETGICHINGPTVYDDPAMPFGGMKASGYGRFGGAAALEEFTELRWIAHHGEGQTYPL